jgi:SHAQKYF class myb-like DNA-binding protein
MDLNISKQTIQNQKDSRKKLPSFSEVFSHLLTDDIVNDEKNHNAKNRKKKIKDIIILSDDSNLSVGRWSEVEEKLFGEALNLYGDDWDKISAHVKTRSIIQIKTHAQKCFKVFGGPKALISNLNATVYSKKETTSFI